MEDQRGSRCDHHDPPGERLKMSVWPSERPELLRIRLIPDEHPSLRHSAVAHVRDPRLVPLQGPPVALEGEMQESHDVLIVADDVMDRRLHGVASGLSRL